MADNIKKETYESSVQLPAGLEPYNKQDYALIDAHYVWVKDDEGELGVRLDDKLKNVGMSQEIKDKIDGVENKVNETVNKVSEVENKINTIETSIDSINNGIIDSNEIIRDLQDKTNEHGIDITNLKEQLSELDPEKLGKIYRTFYNPETYIFYFYQIPQELEDEEPSQEQVDSIIASADYYVYQVEIKGGGGGAEIGTSIPTISLTKVHPINNTVYVKKDAPLSVSFNYNAYYKATESEPQTPYDDTARLSLTINGDEIESKLIVNGTYSFDIGKYLKLGQNNIKFTVVIEIEAVDGRILKVTKPLSWVVNVVDLMISAPTFNDKDLFVYPRSATISGSAVGIIDKTLHYVIDGANEQTRFLGNSSPYSFSINFMTPTTTHGDHTIKIWTTGEVGENENKEIITSNILYFDSIYIRPDDKTPILRSDYDGSDLHQYDTKTFEFSVYNPEKKNTPVEIYVDGKLQTTIVAENGVSQSWAYRPMTSDSFNLMIKVSDTVKKEWHINVVDFGEDIFEIEGAIYDFNPSLINKNNTDSDRGTYIYSSSNGEEYTLKASDNFDWYNGGWKTDEQGIKYLHIMRGTSVTIDYKLFGQSDWKEVGKNFKIIFQTDRCKKMDASIFKCISEQAGIIKTEKYDEDGNLYYEDVESIKKIGVEIDAQNAYLYGNNVNIKGQYMENELTELEFNINNSTNGFSEYMIYNNCDPIQVRAYPSDASFDQDTHSTGLVNAVQNIVIGSNDCDIKLYRFKAYERYLSMEETYQNYVADSLDAIERAEKITRNDIFSSVGSDEYNGLDPDKIAERHPNLRMIFIECKRFTKGKKDAIANCTVQQRMGNNNPKHNWIARNVTLKGQGTSSEFYGPAGRNIDLKFSKSSLIVDAEGNQYAFESSLNKTLRFNKYAMTDNSVPISYVNIKVNIASSENANNAVLADDFNTYEPYLRPMRLLDPRVRDTMEFHPCIIFVRETSESERIEFDDDKWHFYACGDFGNSKKNGEAMGMWLESDVSEEDLPPRADLECIIEFATNGELQQFIFPPNVTTFPEIIVDAEGNITDSVKQSVEIWDENFEFRYPDTGDYLKPNSPDFAEHKASIEEISRKFKQMWDWVNSTDSTKATNNSITPIKYPDNITYNRDTKEYRLAKFKYEFDNYFVSDSVIYDYLFTERHTMVDNRGKNMFIHLNVEPGEYQYKWDFVFDYDNDTAEGCDNLGNLRFPYGKEDIDVDENGSKIFNSSNSVLWVNVRNCFDDRLKTLMARSDVSNFYNAKRIIKKFDDYQWVKPERLEMMDMWRKYYRPWEEKNNNEYLWRMNGRKEFQRKRYETYQGIYIESKYERLTSSSNMKFRSFRQSYINKGGTVKPLTDGYKVIPYSDLYCTVITDPYSITKARGKAGETVTLPFPQNIDAYHDTNIQIPASEYYNSIGDLAQFYIQQDLSLAQGIQLKEILLGYESRENPDVALPNAGLTKSNTMVEYLDLRRNTLEDNSRAVDASTARNLKYINTTGTNVSTVTFCNGGLLEEAYLNAITGLTIRNLLQVKVFECTSYISLTDLTYENCSSTINIVNILNSAPNLNNVYLYNIDITFPDTSVLNRLCDVVKTSVLTGTVKVPYLRPSERRRYEEKWGEDLIIIGNELPEYYVTFCNYDGTVLMNASNTRPMKDIPYDQNALLKSPLVKDNGSTVPEADRVLEIYQTNTPERPETAKYSFEFIGWVTNMVEVNANNENVLDLNITHVTKDMTLYAKYRKTERQYNVYWLDASGNRINEANPVQVKYGQSATFDSKLYKQPDKRPYNGTYFLFDGWKQSTGYITEDMDVEPNYVEGSLPISKDSTLYNPANVKAIIETYRQNGSIQFLNNYLTTDSVINLQMGYVPTFENVEEEIFAQDYAIDGSDSKILNTRKSLMQKELDTEGNSRYKNWTLMLDITYDNRLVQEAQTFVYCRNVLDLSLPYVAGSYNLPSLILGNMGIGNSTTVSTEIPNRADNGMAQDKFETVDIRVRENIVIKYSYDDNNKITVYKNNRHSKTLYDSTIVEAFSINIDEDTGDQFGNLIFGSAENYMQQYRYKSKCIINTAKIWWTTLSDDECKKIVSWTYNKQPMIFVGSNLYQLSNSYAESLASFVCYKETLNARHVYSLSGSSAGGWKYSEMNEYLNNKVLFGINPTWKQLITEMKINSFRGGSDYSNAGFPSNAVSQDDVNKPRNAVLMSNSYLYIPSAYEVSQSTMTKFMPETLGGSYPFYELPDNRKYSELEYGTNTFYHPWSTRSPDIDNNTTRIMVVQPNTGNINSSLSFLTSNNNTQKERLYPYISQNNHYSTAGADMYVVFGFSIG